jgi:hypothetical protein
MDVIEISITSNSDREFDRKKSSDLARKPVSEEIWSKVGLGSVRGKQLVRGMEHRWLSSESDPKLTGTPGGLVGVAGSVDRRAKARNAISLLAYNLAILRARGLNEPVLSSSSSSSLMVKNARHEGGGRAALRQKAFIHVK